MRQYDIPFHKSIRLIPLSVKLIVSTFLLIMVHYTAFRTAIGSEFVKTPHWYFAVLPMTPFHWITYIGIACLFSTKVLKIFTSLRSTIIFILILTTISLALSLYSCNLALSTQNTEQVVTSATIHHTKQQQHGYVKIE